MRKHFKSILHFLLLFVFILTSCEKENIVFIKDTNLKRFKTVNLSEVKYFIENQQNTDAFKKSNTLNLNYDVNLLTYENIDNSTELLAVIPATTKYENINTRILLLNIDNKVKSVLFNMIPSKNVQSEFFTGIISVTDLSGSFLNGYRVLNGVYVSHFIKTIGKNNNSNNKANGDDCDENVDPNSDFCNNLLEEVIITAPPTEGGISVRYIYSYDLHGDEDDGESPTWHYGGGGSNGGNNNCPDGSTRDSNGNCNVDNVSLENNLTDECAKAIFNDLLEEGTSDELKPEVIIPNGETRTFSGAILDLFSNSNEYDYQINNDEILGSYGALTNRDGNTITTTLSNSYLSSATDLAIAATMIHEATHAYMVYKIDTDGDYASVLAEYYSQYGNIEGRSQHEFMIEYINAMAYSLYTWDKNYTVSGGNLGWDYYYAMAFKGMFYRDPNGVTHETDAFIELIPDSNKRDEIIKILINEQTGNENAKGKKCD
jgi:hypothetical protein